MLRDYLDFGDEVNLEFCFDGFLSVMHKVEDVFCGGFSFINKEIGVFFGDLSVADLMAFESGLVEEDASGFFGEGVFEERAGGENAKRLFLEAVFAQVVDSGGLGLLVLAGLDCEFGGKDDFVGGFEVAVAVVQIECFGSLGGDFVGFGIENFRGDQAVFRFEAAATGIAVDCAADGARKADPRFEAGEVVAKHLADEF